MDKDSQTFLTIARTVREPTWKCLTLKKAVTIRESRDYRDGFALVHLPTGGGLSLWQNGRSWSYTPKT